MTSTRPRLVDGLAVYESGRRSAERVVFVHGSMDRAAAFRKAVRRLTDLDIVLYDRRGYARSLDGGVSRSVDALLTDLFTVIDDRPSVVIGHSLGGLITLAAAQQAPALVTAIGVFEAPLVWRAWWPHTSAGAAARDAATEGGPGAAAEQFMRRLIGDERWQALPQGTRQQRRAEGPALLADLTSMRAGAPFDPSQMKLPAVVGYGSQTSDRHRRAAVELAEELPDAELVTIEGASHNAHDSHPAAFADFVRQVVDRAP